MSDTTPPDLAARIESLCNSDDRRLQNLGLALDDIACALDNVGAASVVVESFNKAKLTKAVELLREAKAVYEQAAAIVMAEALDAADLHEARAEREQEIDMVQLAANVCGFGSVR